MQHDVTSLWQIVHDSGITHPHRAMLLDTFPSRMGIVSSSESPIVFPTQKFPQLGQVQKHLLNRIHALLAYAGGACMKRIPLDPVRQCIDALRHELIERAEAASQQSGEIRVLPPEQYLREGIEDCTSDPAFLNRACQLEQRVQMHTSLTQRVRIPALRAPLDIQRIFFPH